MRIHFVDGIWFNELKELLARLRPHNLGAPVYDPYLQQCSWPGSYGSGREVRRKHAGYIPGGSASEQLSVSPAFEKYLVEVVQG
eukprot:9497231-Pyramimonas_sp.AAC.1